MLTHSVDVDVGCGGFEGLHDPSNRPWQGAFGTHGGSANTVVRANMKLAPTGALFWIISIVGANLVFARYRAGSGVLIPIIKQH